MTVFKTFLKILNSYKVPIIMYTSFLIFFGGFNLKTSDTNASFVSSKPDILIVNNDEEEGITKNLIDYIKSNSNIIEIEDNIDDALFYRDVNYIIYIKENYRNDFLDGKNPTIEIKSTGDYQSSLANMILKRYIKVANTYNEIFDNEEDIINAINNTLKEQTDVEITSKLDTTNLSRVTFYYNFLNYSILAGCVYVICLILSSFKCENIKKRTIISSMNYKEYNIKLFLSNSLFAIVLWLFYIVLSFLLLGKTMLTLHGLIYIINSFIFTICSLSIAFLIANLINNKNAINGIINVVALGTSFLCGAFVPMEYLPTSVLNFAHIIPSYYYIKNNELLKTLETISFETIKPILLNMITLIIFMILFIIITNIFSSKKRKIA